MFCTWPKITISFAVLSAGRHLLKVPEGEKSVAFSRSSLGLFRMTNKTKADQTHQQSTATKAIVSLHEADNLMMPFLFVGKREMINHSGKKPNRTAKKMNCRGEKTNRPTKKINCPAKNTNRYTYVVSAGAEKPARFVKNMTWFTKKVEGGTSKPRGLTNDVGRST